MAIIPIRPIIIEGNIAKLLINILANSIMTENRKMNRLTDQKLKEMIAGTEGVTPGLWIVSPAVFNRDGDVGYGSITTAEEDGPWFLAKIEDQPNCEKDAAHIARCDPAAIRAMAEEILASRAEIKRLQDVVMDQAFELMNAEDHTKAAVLAECEACATCCDVLHEEGDTWWTDKFAAAIRARQENGT